MHCTQQLSARRSTELELCLPAGVPFEESKRKAAIPLLHVQMAFMIAIVAFVAYGSYAVSQRPHGSCYVHVGGLYNPYNATTAVVCALWGFLATLA